MQSQMASGALSMNDLNTARTNLRTTIGGMSDFAVQAVRTQSATSMLTEAIIKQDLNFKKSMQVRKQFNNILREQYQLQRMTAVQWTRNAAGAGSGDVIIPRDASARVDRMTQSLRANSSAMVRSIGNAALMNEAWSVMRMRIGLTTAALNASSASMIKWGKNTQWAGRQLMVGFTVPLMAFGAVAGTMAYQVDKELTRIAKVYDTVATSTAGKAAELDRLRTESMSMATGVAKQYGQAVKDTLEIEGDLAATGLKGQELQKATIQVTRAATLGELEKADAIKATISMQSVYASEWEKTGGIAENTAKAFEYMNAMENATSLSMKDFVEAIPRGAGVMKQVGVDLKEMGVILVALKQNGISAAEGMNGMRSAAQRLLMITPQAEAIWSSLLPEEGKLQNIVNKNKGEFIPTLKEMGKAMAGLEKYQQQQILMKVFNVYQSNKVLGVLDGLINRTNQVSTAFDVMEQDSAKSAATAQNELNQLANSASGKFKRALESIKAQLATVGEPFLEVGGMILGWVGKILDFFNAMPGIVKKGLAALVIGGAILGPVIMLLGLFGNLIGQLMKLSAGFIGLFSRFRPMTLEQRAQAMMADRSAAAWNNQGMAARALAGQLQVLTATMERTAIANMNMAGTNPIGITGYGRTTPSSNVIGGIGPTAPPSSPGYRQLPNGRYQNIQTGQFASSREVQAYAAAQAAAARSSAQTATTTAATSRNWGRISMSMGAVGVAAAGMAMMSGSSSEMMNNIMTAVLAASLLGPILVKAFARAGIAAAAANVGAAFSFGRVTGAASGAGRARSVGQGLLAALPAAGRLGMLIARFAGPAGLLATGAVMAYKLYNNMKKGVETQKQINESAKDWADILGFVYSEAGVARDESGKEVLTLDAQVSKLKEKNKQLVLSLQLQKQAGNEQEAMNLAIAEGLKVKNHGGSADQANAAAMLALRAAGYKSEMVEELMIKIKAKVDFSDSESTIKSQMKEFKSQFNKIANNEFGQGAWEGFTRAFSGTGEINKNAAERGKGLASEFWTGFQAQSDLASRKDYFDKFYTSMSAEMKTAWGRLGNDNRADLEKVGITSWEEFSQAFRDQQSMSPVEFRATWGDGDLEKTKQVEQALRSLGGETTEYAQKHIDAEQFIARAIAKKNNMSDKEVEKIHTLKDLYGSLDMATMSVAEATDAYANAMLYSANQMSGMTSKESAAYQLKVLNQYRVAAGLKKTKNFQDGFNKAVTDGTDAVKSDAAALSEAALSVEDWANARQKAMSGAQDYALSAADEIWSERADAEVKAIEDRGQRREDALDAEAERQEDRFDARGEAADKRFDKRAKALDKRWDKTMDDFDDRWDKRLKKEEDAYNKKIERIKNQIQAEEDAEERRQKIFEAEKTRLERLAAIANQSIDFNVALNTGSLDEAAKIFNNIQSTQDSWTLDDAAASSQSSSDARKAGLEGKITTIEEARDKRLESLKKVEEAEKKALEDKKEREQEALAAERERYTKALEAERERYRKGIDAQKKAIQEQTARDTAARKAEVDRQKKTLELELLAIRASVPRNKKEYENQISTIEKLYKKYGVNLKTQGNTWSKTIGNGLTAHIKAASADLKNDINWKSIGGSVTKEMVDGGFGMSTNEFMKWVTTGKLPKNYAGPGKKRTSSNASSWGGVPYAPGQGASPYITRHTGGPVSGNAKYNNRGGRNAGTSLRRDETFGLLKKNEYVMSGNAHKSLGTDYLNDLNNGKYGVGGPTLGLVGMFGAALAGMFSNAAGLGVARAAQSANSFGIDGVGIPGAAGKYGNVNLNSEQLKNAATIIGVGKSLGASTRDNIIAIMTAMQESTLRNLNYGDRDSVGLFQQRNAWGSFEDRTNPAKSARMFFLGGKAGQRGLFDFKNRNQMSLAQAAQAVQVSAFPEAYAKWEAMARQVVSGTGFQAGTTGGTGWRKPVSGPVTQEWSSRHGGMDFGIPTGTTVRAANAGTVTTSADLRGSGNGGYRSYGRYIVVDHGGRSTLYAHLSRRDLGVGARVGSGQALGLSGNTGNSTGPHLHFETRGPGGFPGFNPRSIIPGLASGGFTLNDGLAMLHKKETVLTAPLSAQLKSGIQKIDQGVNNDYNVNVNFYGPVNSDVDVEKAVTAALNKRDSKLGRNRSIK